MAHPLAIGGVHHLRLTVTDVNRSRAFYTSHKVYVLRVMTHADYDREDWPSQCGCYRPQPQRSRPVGQKSHRKERPSKPRPQS